MSQMSCRVCSILFFVSYVILGSHCYAQNTGTFSGRVIDSKDKKPVPFLSIFFANTLMGCNSDENGYFKINNIPFGKYSLTISGVGYKLVSKPIEINGTSDNNTFSIEQEVKQLNEVVVKSRDNKFAKNYRTFKKYFLGESSNASFCKILNPEAIDLEYDYENDVLTATAQEPIKLLNNALGYKLYYVLNKFKLDNKNGLIIVSGIPRFEYLSSEKESKERKWDRHRDKAYYGSANHFFRCLFNRTTRENQFVVYKVLGNKDEFFNPDSLFEKGNSNIIHFKGKIKVVFNKEQEEYSYYRNGFQGNRPQTTILEFTNEYVKVYENGYFEDPLSVVMNGYMGWERIAELVPLEYKPTTNLIK